MANKAKWYDDINKCPMANFIDAQVDGNYRSLLIEGEVEDFVLQDAFMSMQEKYSMALGDVDQSMYLKLIREINYDQADLNIANTILGIAPNAWIPRYETRLNKIFGVRYKADATNRIEFNKVLSQWDMRIAGLEMRIELKKNRAEIIQKRIAKKGGGKPTREHYSVIFNCMEEFYNVPINETITVARYCDRYKRMSKQTSKPYGRSARR